MVRAPKVKEPNQKFIAARQRLESKRDPGTTMTQEEFADECNQWLADTEDPDGPITASTISKIEQGYTTWPRVWRRKAYRAITGAATDAELGFHDKRRRHKPAPTDPITDIANFDPSSSEGLAAGAAVTGPANKPAHIAITGLPPSLSAELATPFGPRYGDRDELTDEGTGVESPFQIAARRRISRSSNTSEPTLQYVEGSVGEMIDKVERDDALTLVPPVRHLRSFVDGLLRGGQHPDQRLRLYTAAARLSGILSALALDLGARRSAHEYAQESFDIADDARLGDVQAWSRAVQSLVAYYSGDYRDAVAYARDGQRRAQTSVHQIRLAVNGEARALARLDDRRGVDEAVDRAFTIVSSLPASPQISTSLSLDAYCPARVAANAATAYLAINKADKVDTYLDTAVAAFDAAELHGPRALSRLDKALAAISWDDPDPQQAGAYAMQALALNAEHPLESVTQRTIELLHHTRPWKDLPAIQAVAETVRERRSAQRALTANTVLS